jgi:elongation factor Ts
MSAITAQTVNELRGRTGAGLMDCKRALTEAAGDMEKAVEILRIKGMATRDKKSGRSANEGVLVLRLNADASSATVLELNCETDFVAKNEAFIILANDLAAQVEAHGHADLTNQVFHKTGQKVNDYLAEQVTKLGENLKVSRSLTLSAGPGSKLASYVHNGSKIAVVLELAAGGSAVGHAGLADLGRQLAMQVVANGAEYLRREEVSADRLEKERVIAEEFTKSEADKAIAEALRIVEDYKGQLAEQKAGANDAAIIVELEKRILNSEKAAKAAEARKSGQIANIEKIKAGRVEKFLAERCLLDQPFFRDPDKKVSELIEESAKTLGGSISVVRFHRFAVGESADQA